MEQKEASNRDWCELQLNLWCPIVRECSVGRFVPEISRKKKPPPDRTMLSTFRDFSEIDHYGNRFFLFFSGMMPEGNLFTNRLDLFPWPSCEFLHFHWIFVIFPGPLAGASQKGKKHGTKTIESHFHSFWKTNRYPYRGAPMLLKWSP